MGSPPLKGRFALVVDDDISIRTRVMHILKKMGLQVMGAENADVAFDLLQTRHPDIALLFTDVRMPGKLDGFVLARNVAKSWPHISIVVTSGDGAPGLSCMPDTARFIAKPFSARLVRACLQEILSNGPKLRPLKRGQVED